MTSVRTQPADRLVIRGRPAILQRVLGGLFTVMAAFQLADLPGFVRVLETFQLGGTAVAWAIAMALLAGELVSGGWLLIVPRRRPLLPAWVFAATAVLWSALAAQAFARGLALDNCGCFGVYLAQPLRWWVLLQDAALLGYAALLLRAADRRPPTAQGIYLITSGDTAVVVPGGGTGGKGRGNRHRCRWLSQ
ncbi:MAG: MauE/DoxX family redox-associated membrane protein [Pseudonocardia sp.]